MFISFKKNCFNIFTNPLVISVGGVRTTFSAKMYFTTDCKSAIMILIVGFG